MNNRRSVKRRWCREQGQDGTGWDTTTTVNYSSVIARLGIFKSYHQARRKCQLRVPRVSDTNRVLVESWPSPFNCDSSRRERENTQLDGNLFVLWLWSVKQNCQRATEKRNLLGNFWEVVHLPPHRERDPTYSHSGILRGMQSLSLCFVTQASRDVVDAANSGKKSMWKSKITSPAWHSPGLPPSLSLPPAAACLGVTHKGLRLKLAEKSVILSFGLACGVLMIFLFLPLSNTVCCESFRLTNEVTEHI